jgi:hypothetical protein
MPIAQLIAAYEDAVQRLSEAAKVAHAAGYGHEFTRAYEIASTNRLELVFAAVHGTTARNICDRLIAAPPAAPAAPWAFGLGGHSRLILCERILRRLA